MTTTRCARCDSPLVEIRIARAETTVVMQSCSTCDTRWWQEDGRAVALPQVLDAVGKR